MLRLKRRVIRRLLFYLIYDFCVLNLSTKKSIVACLSALILFKVR
jgi:hypothetical protein